MDLGGCIISSYGVDIGVDEPGDSTWWIFGAAMGCPGSTTSSKATPHEQSSSFGHGTRIEGAKGDLAATGGSGVVLPIFSRDPYVS